MKSRISLIVAGSALVGLSVWMYVQWRHDLTVDPDAPIHALADSAARQFADYSMVSLQGDVDVRSLFSSAPVVVGDDLHDPERFRRLGEFIAGYVTRCFLEENPDAYLAWRESEGSELRSLEDIRSDPRLNFIYPYFFDKAPPPGATAREVFTSVWDAHRAHDHGANQPVGVSDEPGGVFVWYGLLTQRQQGAPTLPRELGVLWTGGVSMASGNFWDDPLALERAMERDGEVLGGFVGWLVEFKDGTRRPLTWCCWWDATEGRWRPITLLQGNVYEDGKRPPDI